MKAHIVGGGFGGMAAAGYLILNAGVPGRDITIYEADEKPGGGFYLDGNASTGYNIPGSVFDKEFRCSFRILEEVPSARDPSVSVRDDFLAFNERYQFNDLSRLIDSNLEVLHGPRFGLAFRDILGLARLSLTPEKRLEDRRIEEFFAESFFSSEFWLSYSTVMGPLPEHSATEFRRYINRTLHLLPSVSDWREIMRSPVDQYQAFVEPVAKWLKELGVDFQTGTFVRDLGLVDSSEHLTVERLDLEKDGSSVSIQLGPEDIVLATFGSQAADRSVGSMTEEPPKVRSGRSWELWRRLAEGRSEFGDPWLFFGKERIPASHWVTFTVTTTDRRFLDIVQEVTRSESGRGGLVTLVDSSWLISFTVFHQPEVIGQPDDTYVWWGYGLYPECTGDFVKKRMDECTGTEILEEVLRQLHLEAQIDAIAASSVCVPCDLPYVNNIWMPRKRNDRPQVVPPGSKNLGLVGQYVEVPKDIAFTIEYSCRTAWQAVYELLGRGPAPPPVYQAQYDPKALYSALKVFLISSAARP